MPGARHYDQRMRGLTLGEQAYFDSIADEIDAIDRKLRFTRPGPAAQELRDRRRHLVSEISAIAESDGAESDGGAYRRHLEAYVATGDPDHLAAMLDCVQPDAATISAWR